MGLEAGKMNERLTFLSPETVENGTGEQITQWNPAATVWATVGPSSGRRFNEDGSVELSDSRRVWTRLRKDASERWRVVWRGTTYAVDALEKDYSEGRMVFKLTKLSQHGAGD